MMTIDAQVSTQVDISTPTGEQPRMSVRHAMEVVINGFSAMIDTLLDWQERARQRRELLGLGDRALQDFGSCRAEADAEGSKPFWQS
jgi:uncharacterized protein YjiS (DUF1127 family)